MQSDARTVFKLSATRQNSVEVIVLHLFGKAEPLLQIWAEVTVSCLLLRRRAEAIFLTSNSSSWRRCAITAAPKHLMHCLVVEVYMEISRYLSSFSYIQQSERHKEGFNLGQKIRLSNVSLLSTHKTTDSICLKHFINILAYCFDE